jgi:Nucleotidyl transferase AbiEii toxin, Type IV TA system
MLHVESLKGNSLDILKGLMLIPELDCLNLAGGTALALKYGHRISIDLDLFSSVDFENKILFNAIQKKYPSYQVLNINNKAGLFGFIDGVKLDIVRHEKFTLIAPVDTIEEIRFLSDADIAAMKIFAILERSKKKDMYDISLLLDKHGLEKIIHWYFKKYPENNMLISVPTALLYFVETESDIDPETLINQKWTQVKKNVSKHVNHYLK